MSTQPISISDAQKGRQIATATPSPASAFANADSFALLQRIGNMFSRSLLVPKQFQGDEGLPDCIIAVNMANRIGADPLMVMQNLYVVHGKPAWSGQFVIAAINQSGRFAEPLHFEEVGERDKDSWGFRAEAVTKSGRVIKGPTVTIGMAKAEGWWGKNPKWKNMPELMLRYRAGSLFGRTECPELLMGFQTKEEVVDGDILTIDPETGEVIESESSPKTYRAPSGGQQAKTVNTDPETQTVEEFEESLPWGEMSEDERQAECARQLAERGYYEVPGQNGPRYFNQAGDQWNPKIHATSTETNGPIVNQDGSFRARRGVTPQEVAAVKNSEGSSETQEAENNQAHDSKERSSDDGFGPLD